MNRAALSAAAGTDMDSLAGAIQTNLKQLDADVAAVAQLMPLLPFARQIVELSEARIRMEDMDAERAAGTITDITRQVGRIRARLEAGLGATGTPADALRGADAVDNLWSSVTSWFNFYNSYDPIFTWWMGMPYRKVDAALQGYAVFLREKVAAADLRPAGAPEAASLMIPAAPAPKLNQAPDLQELLALPQDEMTSIVQRFQGQSAGGPGDTRGPKYYEAWPAALKTLDFEKLSRNAQIDYIKKRSEIQIARALSSPSNSTWGNGRRKSASTFPWIGSALNATMP